MGFFCFCFFFFFFFFFFYEFISFIVKIFSFMYLSGLLKCYRYFVITNILKKKKMKIRDGEVVSRRLPGKQEARGSIPGPGATCF